MTETKQQNDFGIFETIYAIVDPQCKNIHYIGRTKFLKGRVRTHLSKGKKNLDTPLYHWIYGIISKGLLPEFIILETNIHYTKASKTEAKWIKFYLGKGLTLYNKVNLTVKATGRGN
jgi:hypothetical protein